MKAKIAAIILAAGKGERMKSQTPKVLHEICFRPMLGYVLDLVKELKTDRSISVLGFKHEQVNKVLPKGIETVVQKRLLGTGDAVKQALGLLNVFHGVVLVLYADIPLLKAKTIKELIRRHNENRSDITLLTARVEKPDGYGRILRDKYASICGIVEEKDADDFQKGIKEINTGIACFNKDKLFSALKKVKPNNRKKEYYLTDVIEIIYKGAGIIDNLNISDIQQAMGVNSRLDLAKANKVMQQRINERLLIRGVTLIDPSTCLISYDARIGQDTVIYPFTVIEKNVRIGKSCQIGPFIHFRPGTVLKDKVIVGNFLEISRSQLGSNTIAKHFGYIGDSRIGKEVNIGAGTVTANFDGKNKNITVIKDKAFIGSDTVLVAPVKIGRSAMTGAGSVVTRNKNVPDGQVVAGVPARPIKVKG
ncbi:MAG: NTP transferase domain-containing protein [Candidatus Omnitrophota bacterium]|nr:NTP transferase domain-containing protein [Candidatus Omnitrophota bacterium]